MTSSLPVLPQDVLADTLSSMAVRADGSALEKHALLQAAGAAKTKALRAAQAILELPPHATQGEVRKARRGRAVRRGKDVYLPTWQELCTGFPNVLLRSALWSVQSIRHDGPAPAEGQTDVVKADEARVLPSFGNTTLINRGPALGGYDRSVFAACLDYYREDRPLSPGGPAQWIEVSFYKFLESMGVSYHADSYRALRASLERLSAISLHVRHQGLELQIPRVLEVSFADGDARGDVPKSSDLIYFRILEPFAELYGSSKWTKVSHDALSLGIGLKSWLASFYASHKKPFDSKIVDLHQMCGSAARLSKFRVQLRDALTELQAPDQPLEVRVKEFVMDKTTVTVTMANWSKA